MDVLSLLSQAETYFQQRERCFDNCWSTQLQLRQLDQQVGNCFYSLTQQGDAIKNAKPELPLWVNVLLSETVAELIQLLEIQRTINNAALVCIQWWSQQNNGAALVAALISIESTKPELTQQLLCVIGSATKTINDQFNFSQMSNIKPCINFINQHLGTASKIWFSHLLQKENTDEKSKIILELTLCRGSSAVQLPDLNSTLLEDKELIKQYVIQSDSLLSKRIINALSKHNDNATFVLSMMAFSGYKQFIPWLIQMLTADFLSRAAFTALHTLLGDEFEQQLPAGLYAEYEPESEVELLAEFKQTLSDWWALYRDTFPDRMLAGKPITEENITRVWHQGNILQCEVSAYHYWCMQVGHRLTDARGFNVGTRL